MEISRRQFFKIGSAAAVTITLPVPNLIPDESGAWMWADGSLLDEYQFPGLFKVLGMNYGGSPGLGPGDNHFRLPDLRAMGFRYLIKVRPSDADPCPVGQLVAYAGEELPG